MESTNISKLKQYADVVDDVNELIDFNIKNFILGCKEYLEVYKKPDEYRLNELFNKIVSKGNHAVNNVLEYLKNKYPEIEDINRNKQHFKRCSVRGGFPKLPPNFVSRTSLATETKDILQKLEWDKKLVVYGMIGSGKSCLLNDVLNDPKLRAYFDFNIFWLNLGEHHDETNILQPMWRLYTSASNTLNRFHCPDDVQILKLHLKQLFSEEHLQNALLILDDVCNNKVLNYFDVGCKTVITTQDKKILGTEDAHYLEVKTAFERDEALNLFKLSLNTTKDLPPAAIDVYNSCKGHPMLVASIGSYLRDNFNPSFKTKNDIWEHINMMFLKGVYRLNKYDTDTQFISEQIKKCVDTLLFNNKDLKAYYVDLSIFMQDVNIPPEVLEILWDTTPLDVMHIMNKLAEKSLVTPFYHEDFQKYIYAIHDIHLTYIKEETKTRIHTIHKKLIDGYDKKTNGNLALLPNDNYSLQFIGYHLFEAKMFDRFSIYFDLRFLEAKIKAVGKADVLRDMDEYKEVITKNEKELEQKLIEYKEFVTKHGANLFNFPKTDIVQYALQEHRDCYVYKEAFKLAKESPHLYFQFMRPGNSNCDYTETIHVKDDITCACFVDSSQHILVGCKNGKIKFFYEQYEKEISSFVDHLSAIKNLVVSPDKSHFLSVGEDGIVNLWKFSADSKRNSIDAKLPVSPKTSQWDWANVFTPDKGHIKPKKIFKMDNDQILSATFPTDFPKNNRIATGSRKGNCLIWDIDTKTIIFDTGNRGYEIPWVYMSPNDLIYAYDDFVYFLKIHSLEHPVNVSFQSSLLNKENVQSFFLNDKELVAVTESRITWWSVNPKHITKIFKNGHRNNCAALTNDYKYLIVSTDESMVYIWDLERKVIVQQLKNKGMTQSLDTFYDENNEVHLLLIGSDKKSLQQCHISPSTEPEVNNLPLFMPYWKKRQPFTPLVSHSENKIQVFSGYTLISESASIEHKVTRICLSVCGNNVIYGLANGDIYTFNIKTKTVNKLSNVLNRGPITYLKTFDPEKFYFNRCRLESTSSSNGSINDLNSNNESYNGVVISLCENDYVTAHRDEDLNHQIIKKPEIFFKNKNAILVDQDCQVYKWDVLTNDISLYVNSFNYDNAPLILSCAAYCELKNYLAVTYRQGDSYFLDIASMEETEVRNFVNIKIRSNLEDVAKCCMFSANGDLLAVGLNNGNVCVWNTSGDFKRTTLVLHTDAVEQLLFSPSVEPILVSLSEEVAFWSLKSLKQQSKVPSSRPPSIDILDNLCEDIGFWCDRVPLNKESVLLSCVRLHGKAKFISSSNDFTKFLLSDEKGKLYIMEAIKDNFEEICS